MRVASRGNLTVELIRLHRFNDGFAHRVSEHRDPHREIGSSGDPRRCPHADRVELSPEALAKEPWSSDRARAVAPAEHALESPVEDAAAQRRKPITPIVGSPALAGLGVALIVPGTLLDVVA